MSKINDAIFDFPSPEKADEIIKSRIECIKKFRKGGNSRQDEDGVKFTNWLPYEIMIRNSVILEYICNQGCSRRQVALLISDRWKVNVTTAYDYIKDAFKALERKYDENTEEIRKTQLERLESMLQGCLENEQTEAALKVMEQMNKIYGLYCEKKEVEVKNDKIEFKFGSK